MSTNKTDPMVTYAFALASEKAGGKAAKALELALGDADYYVRKGAGIKAF